MVGAESERWSRLHAIVTSARDLSVRKKIIAAFACVLVATLVLGLFAVERLWVMNAHARRIGEDWFPSAKVMHELSYLTARVRIKEATYLLESSDEAREMRLREVRMLDNKVTAALDQTLALAHSGEDRRLATDLAKKWKVYRAQEAELVREQASDPVSAFVFYTGEYKNTFDEFRAVMEEIVAASNAMGESRVAASGAAWRSGLLWILAALTAAVLLCIGAGVLLIEAVSAPLGRMTTAVEELAAGNLEVQVPHAGQKDEIGTLAATMRSFKDQLAAADRSKAEQVETIVSSIGAGLDQLARGDLTYRISTALAGPFVKLKDDFNAAMARLQETIKTVMATAAKVVTGADEIADAADALSQRTERQAATLEETAAALNEITKVVKDCTANTKQVNASMAWARAAAVDGGKVVENATGAMDAIAYSSTRITDIIGVIDEIAFQTNLLALNAGVEAARAGDAGRGFAVVASEVRALAQRSSKAAKEIKALINESGAQVSGGVKLVAESGKALSQIAVRVSEIDGVMGDIAIAADREVTGIDQVNAAVGELEQVTQHNAAMVEQSTAASRALAAETQKLRELVGFFSVGASEPASRPAVQVRAGGSCRAAAAAASPGEDWTEF